MISTELLTAERESEFEEFVRTDERALFNCSLKFRELMRRITKAEECYLIAVEHGRIVGTLPSFVHAGGPYGSVLNSMPWYGSNPGICIGPNCSARREVKGALLDAFNGLAKEKRCVASTIITRPFEADLDLFEERTQYTYRDSRLGLVTPLPAYGSNIEIDLMTILHSKTRNLVRKSQKSGMTFRHDKSKEALDFLVQTHTTNMIEVGAPPKGRNLFDEVADLFTYDDDYRIYIAELDGTKVAALLLKYYAKTVDYFTPAIIADYRELQPLNLLIFNAMMDASAKGYKYWNWGGTTLPSQEGVYHFKKRWGAEECTYYYYTRSYDESDRLVHSDRDTLLKGYPYFYVLPFSELITNDGGEI
jgi:hypothetical protein